MDEKKKLGSIFYQNVTTTFTPTIIAASIASWLTANAQSEPIGLIRLGREGLAIESIAQLFAWSVVLSIFITLLTSGIFLKKIMLLWRVVALFFLGIISCITFAVVFHWFPLDEWGAWAFFLLIFSGCFGFGLFFMVAKTKIEDRRLSKLLSNYKSKRSDKDD